MTHKQYTVIALCLMLMFTFVLTGCKKQAPEPAAVQVNDIDLLQGTWKGTETGSEAEWVMVFNGDKASVDGPGPQDYAGSITLDETTTPKSAIFAIETCAFEQYVGKAANNIYKLEGETLTLAGTEPGSGTKPATFEAGNGTRVFTLTKVQTQ